MMSFAPQLQFGGEFKENVMRFAGEQEAMTGGEFLAARWPAGEPDGVRVIGSSDPVNYKFANGVLIRIEQGG